MHTIIIVIINSMVEHVFKLSTFLIMICEPIQFFRFFFFTKSMCMTVLCIDNNSIIQIYSNESFIHLLIRKKNKIRFCVAVQTIPFIWKDFKFINDILFYAWIKAPFFFKFFGNQCVSHLKTIFFLCLTQKYIPHLHALIYSWIHPKPS